MAYHDRKLMGPMQQKTIVTKGLDNAKEHDAKVDKFNAEHEVFFNQVSNMVVTVGAGSIVLWVTVCLYVPLRKQ